MKQLALVFAMFVAACIPPAGAGYQSAGYGYAPAGTGVYVNGQELTASEKIELERILGGAVPAGRYALDAQYNFGYEGQAPVVNLAAHAPRAESGSKEPFSMYSTDAAGQGSSLVSDGDCMIMSTPSGSLSSGC